MFLNSYIFKTKAVRSLKGNWQTALLVTFIAGLPSTVSALLRSTQLPQVTGYSFDAILAASRQVTGETIWLLSLIELLVFIITPMLALGCNNYFIQRINGKELGIAGVLSRRKVFLRALWLYILMAVRILLWTLLFIVPGIIAALRYAMAPYFLAENTELTASEAIEKSKAVMADKKLSYFMLLLSFIGWVLLAMAVQLLMMSFGSVISLVAYQFVELVRITYVNAAVAAFYIALSRADGMHKAQAEADTFVKQIQGDAMRGSQHENPNEGQDENQDDPSDPDDKEP